MEIHRTNLKLNALGSSLQPPILCSLNHPAPTSNQNAVLSVSSASPFSTGFWQNPKAALVFGPTSSLVSSFILHLSAFARFSLCSPLPYPQDVFVKDFYQTNTPITFLHTEFLDSICCPKWGFKWASWHQFSIIISFYVHSLDSSIWRFFSSGNCELWAPRIGGGHVVSGIASTTPWCPVAA